MAATYTDKNGIVWATIYDAPTFEQIHPWQGYTGRYPETPHLFAFTESGLHDDLEEYAHAHTPSAPSAPGAGPSVTYTKVIDARDIVWLLRTDSIRPDVWTGFAQSVRYGVPAPTVTATTEALARAQIAAYAVGHPLLPVTPVPTRPPLPPSGKGPTGLSPVAVAMGLLGLGMLLLGRRS